MSTNNHLLKDFLAGLRRTRTGSRTSAEAIYWRAVTSIAAGVKPKDREADIVEAMEKLGRDENALAADAQRVALLAQVAQASAQEPDARARLKAAATAQAEADRRAGELLREADRMRAEAQAATAEARNEVDTARKAAQRAASLRLELCRLGHPDYAGEADSAARQREIERLEADLRSLEPEVREAIAVAEAVPAAEDRSTDGATAGARGWVLHLTQKRDRLVRRLEEVKAGGPIDAADDDGEIDDVEPLAEEVGHG